MYDLAAPTLEPTRSSAIHRAVLLNGALPGDETLNPIEQSLLTVLLERRIHVRDFQLRNIPLAFCQGCFECWTRSPGLCKTDGDAGREIAAAMIASDLTVCLTRVTFGGYSSEIKKALDRMIGLVSPFFRRIEGEVHHRTRYRSYPSLAVVGITSEPDLEEERIFRTLVARNARNMDSPAHAASVLPVNLPPSATRGRLEDDLQPVLRSLARRVA